MASDHDLLIRIDERIDAINERIDGVHERIDNINRDLRNHLRHHFTFTIVLCAATLTSVGGLVVAVLT